MVPRTAGGLEYGTQVTSNDGGPGPDPVDPDFAALFRPDDEWSMPAAPPENEPAGLFVDDVSAEVPDPVAAHNDADAPLAEDSSDAPAVEQPPVDVPGREPATDTGRLFRSQGVRDHEEAVLALTSDHFGRLRTLERRYDVEPAVPDIGPLEPEDAGDPQIAGLLGASTSGTAAGAEPEPAGHRRRGRRVAGMRAGARGISAGAVYLIVIGVTVLVAFANALLAGGSIGWPTGVALAASSVYAALTVRREDDVVAILIPPVAFLIAALTAGQLFLGSAEGSLLNRAVVAFFSLADNWIWIIGSTVAALIIVLVRRRRA